MCDVTRAQPPSMQRLDDLVDVMSLYVDDNVDVVEKGCIMWDAEQRNLLTIERLEENSQGMKGLFKRTHSIDVDNDEQDSEELMGYMATDMLLCEHHFIPSMH